MTCAVKTERNDAQQTTVARPVRERRSSVPRHEVFHSEKTYEVKVYLPGVSHEGLDIQLEDSLLTVKGKAETHDYTGFKLLHREYSEVDYEAAFRIPPNVNRGEISAKLENGVLTLGLPIRAKERKSININMG